MLIFTEPARPGAVLIPQVSHAWLGWQIAMHWGNRRFLRPAPRAETLAAVLLHDSGWTGYDAEPTLDAAGKIQAFDAMPLETHLAIWQNSVARTAQTSCYAGLLVAAHHRLLAARKATGGDNSATVTKAIAAFVEATRAQEARWIASLGTDTRSQPFLDGPQRRANQEILTACDAISVYLCAAFARPFTLSAVSHDGTDIPIRVDPAGPRTWRLNPWPLEGTRLAVHCEGRAVSSPFFADPDAARDALATAPTVRLSFTLIRPSASAHG